MVLAVVILSIVYPGLVQQEQLIPGMLLLLLVGLPQGATDYTLVRQRAQVTGESRIIRFSLHYLFLMLAYALLWYVQPLPAFLLFLVISVYHFGQANWWRLPEDSSLRLAMFILWGSFVLFTPLLLHYEEAAPILSELLGREVPPIKGIIRYLVPGLLFNLNIILILYAGGRNRIVPLRMKWELFQLGLLFVLFWFAPLLVGLAVYFVLFHSMEAARDQIEYFQDEEPDFTWKKYLVRALPLALVCLAAGITWYLSSVIFEASLWRLSWFFIFISLISLPHVILMEGFYNRQRRHLEEEAEAAEADSRNMESQAV